MKISDNFILKNSKECIESGNMCKTVNGMNCIECIDGYELIQNITENSEKYEYCQKIQIDNCLLSSNSNENNDNAFGLSICILMLLMLLFV